MCYIIGILGSEKESNIILKVFEFYQRKQIIRHGALAPDVWVFALESYGFKYKDED